MKIYFYYFYTLTAYETLKLLGEKHFLVKYFKHTILSCIIHDDHV